MIESVATKEIAKRTSDLETSGRNLEDLAQIANCEHELVLSTGTAMIGHAILAGEALLAAKKLVPRGEWEQWLVDNVADRSLSTPRTYMRLAVHKEKIIEAQPTSMKGARRVLWGAHSSHAVTDEEVKEMKLLRRRGLSYAAIGDALGANESSVYRHVNPKYGKRRLARAKRKTMAMRRAYNREKRDAIVKKAGGAAAEAYAMIRRTLKILEVANTESESPEARRAIQDAMNRLYNAEDAMLKAVTVSPQEPAKEQA